MQGWQPNLGPNAMVAQSGPPSPPTNAQPSQSGWVQPWQPPALHVGKTFLTSQRCTAVSIDTCIAVARFPGQFWRFTRTPPGFVKTPTLPSKCLPYVSVRIGFIGFMFVNIYTTYVIGFQFLRIGLIRLNIWSLRTFTKSQMYTMGMIGFIGSSLELNEMPTNRYNGRLDPMPLRNIG